MLKSSYFGSSKVTTSPLTLLTAALTKGAADGNDCDATEEKGLMGGRILPTREKSTNLLSSVIRFIVTVPSVGLTISLICWGLTTVEQSSDPHRSGSSLINFCITELKAGG